MGKRMEATIVFRGWGSPRNRQIGIPRLRGSYGSVHYLKTDRGGTKYVNGQGGFCVQRLTLRVQVPNNYYDANLKYFRVGYIDPSGYKCAT